MKQIYMADGLFLYKTNDSYVVTDKFGNILKQSKTLNTCDNYIIKTLESRRAAEKYASSLNILKEQGIL